MNFIDKDNVLNDIDESIRLIDSKNRKTLSDSYVVNSLKTARDYINSDSLFNIDDKHLHAILSEYNHTIQYLIKTYNLESVYVYCSLSLTHIEELLSKYYIPILYVYASLLKSTLKQLL